MKYKTRGRLGILNETYDAGDIVDLDPKKDAVKASVAAGDLIEVKADDLAQDLMDAHTRKELDKKAEGLDIDVSEFTNKREVAEAILEAGQKSGG